MTLTWHGGEKQKQIKTTIFSDSLDWGGGLGKTHKIFFFVYICFVFPMVCCFLLSGRVCVFYFLEVALFAIFLNSLTNKFKHKWVYHSSHTLYTIADTHSKARRIAETISSKRKLHKIIFCQECAHVSTCFPSRSFVLLLAL